MELALDRNKDGSPFYAGTPSRYSCPPRSSSFRPETRSDSALASLPDIEPILKALPDISAGEPEITTFLRAAVHFLWQRPPYHGDSLVYYANGAFGDVTKNPDYYPFHAEVENIESRRQDIASYFESCDRLIIIGGGPERSLMAKEGVILEEILKAGSSPRDIVLIEPVESYRTQQKSCISRIFNKHAMDLPQIHTFMDYRYAMDTAFGSFLNEDRAKKTGVMCTGSLLSQISVASPGQPARYSLAKALSSFGVLGDVLWLGYNSAHQEEDVAKISKAYAIGEIDSFIENVPTMLAEKRHDDSSPLVTGLKPSGFKHEVEIIRPNDDGASGLQVAHSLRVSKRQTVTLNMPQHSRVPNPTTILRPGELMRTFFTLTFNPDDVSRIAGELDRLYSREDQGRISMPTLFRHDEGGMTTHIFEVKRPASRSPAPR